MNYEYSPPSRLKKPTKEQRTKEDSVSILGSKRSQCKILCKRNNVIEMARKEVMGL